MYFGASVGSDALNEECNETETTLGKIILVPSGEMDVFPPTSDALITERWRGMTAEYRPLTEAIYGGHNYVGKVRIPGDFGTWEWVIAGTQYSVPDCDTHISINNGVLQLHECHHVFTLPFIPAIAQADWTLTLDNLNGNLSNYYLQNIEWNMAVTGEYNLASFGFGLGDESGEGTFHEFEISPGSYPVEPMQLMYNPYFQLSFSTTADAAEVNNSTVTINDLTLGGKRSHNPIDSDRNLGKSPCALTTNSPINLATGNMYHIETDFDLNLPGLGLKFIRAY
jgi:hypothetical protein